METLWSKRPSAIRELQEAFPEAERPAYTTVQTVVYRLEFKKAVHRTTKINNARVFEAVLTRSSALQRMVDDLVALFGGKPMPIVAHLLGSGRLTPQEVREARKVRRNLARKDKRQ